MMDHGAEPAALAGIDVGGEDCTLDREALVRMLSALGLERLDVDLIVSMLAQQESRLTPFEMRMGNWSLTVPTPTARALFNSTVLTGALAAVHEPSIPAAVLTFAVLSLFDIDRVTVTRRSKAPPSLRPGSADHDRRVVPTASGVPSRRTDRS